MVWIEVIIESIVGPRQTDADAGGIHAILAAAVSDDWSIFQTTDDIDRAVNRSPTHDAGARARIDQPYSAVIKFFACALRASHHSRRTLYGRLDGEQRHERRVTSEE
jgi:hypothetical protein